MNLCVCVMGAKCDDLAVESDVDKVEEDEADVPAVAVPQATLKRRVARVRVMLACE